MARGRVGGAPRLSRGERVHIGRIEDLFAAEEVQDRRNPRVKRTTYRQSEQSLIEDLTGSFADRLARSITAAIERASEDSVTVLDLTGIVQADPSDLVSGLRAGISGAHPSGPAWRGPRWTAGRRFVAIRYRCRRHAARTLRAAVETRWELEDRRRPGERLPVPMLTEDGGRILGHLPPRMSGARLERLLDQRVITYHALIVAPGQPGNSAKATGRELLRYERLGLLVRREHPSMVALAELGVPEDPKGRARPRLWESVPAAARVLFPR